MGEAKATRIQQNNFNIKKKGRKETNLNFVEIYFKHALKFCIILQLWGSGILLSFKSSYLKYV